MNLHTIHESEVSAVHLPGRWHKMIVGPGQFGPASHMCFGVAEFPPDEQAPEHVHEQAEEILYILTGRGQFFFDGHPEEVEPGVCVYVPPGVFHRISVTGNEILKVAYVFSPPVRQGSYDRK